MSFFPNGQKNFVKLKINKTHLRGALSLFEGFFSELNTEKQIVGLFRNKNKKKLKEKKQRK